MQNIYTFSSERFLEDVKSEIKYRYHNQGNYAKKLFLSRKVLSRILNNPQELTIVMINRFCLDLSLNFKDYLL